MFRNRIPGVALTLLALVALVALPALAEETSLYMDSEPGDYIGQGQEWSYTPETADFSAGQVGGNNGVSINLQTNDPSWGWWDLYFTAPDGQELTVGEYTGATRWPFNDPGEPGLSISGMGRGCNTLTGSFFVHEVVFGSGGTVESFWATFEQHCEGGDPALYGDVRFNAGVVATLQVSWGELKQSFR